MFYYKPRQNKYIYFKNFQNIINTEVLDPQTSSVMEIYPELRRPMENQKKKLWAEHAGASIAYWFVTFLNDLSGFLNRQ